MIICVFKITIVGFRCGWNKQKIPALIIIHVAGKWSFNEDQKQQYN